MTYTYTPQAGDVIESPVGLVKWVIVNSQTDVTTSNDYFRDSTSAHWKVRHLGRTRPTMKVQRCVDADGWKLVARGAHE